MVSSLLPVHSLTFYIMYSFMTKMGFYQPSLGRTFDTDQDRDVFCDVYVSFALKNVVI